MDEGFAPLFKKELHMFDLTGKNALITGASGGIGGEIAKVLHAAGATVGLSGTRVEPLEALAAELGERAFVLPCNLSDKDSVVALPKAAIEAMGSVDILVNNAGITRDNLFMRMSDDEWDSVLNVNLTSTMRLCKGVLRPMMKARWGRIINISSIVGATGNPGQGNYAASKAGVVGMSKSLAYEVASRGITVNCVAPGFIATAMTDKLTDDQKEKINQQIPAARMGTPAEIAASVLYLASNEAGYTTGATIHVNGGMAML
jgi:3-oxoacyl-[acyl-carrier protein] reductase